MKIDLDFTGRHVLVVGGTTGINLGIAQAFARQGARVSVVSRSAQNVAEAERSLAQLGGGVFGVCADVRDAAAVAGALAQAAERFGPLDVLVSGAAGNFLAPATAITSNGFRAVLEIDLLGSFHVLREAFPHLRKPGAAVINISAPQAVVPMRYQAHCGAAKAGVEQLTRILALEWGALGVRINAISPGPIDGTEGFRRLMAATPEQRSATEAAVPLRRLGTLDDIANLALFLASPFASYISGAVIPCDGGGALESVKPALEAAGHEAAAVPPSH